jgi:hypothetical protein
LPTLLLREEAKRFCLGSCFHILRICSLPLDSITFVMCHWILRFHFFAIELYFVSPLCITVILTQERTLTPLKHRPRNNFNIVHTRCGLPRQQQRITDVRNRANYGFYSTIWQQSFHQVHRPHMQCQHTPSSITVFTKLTNMSSSPQDTE